MKLKTIITALIFSSSNYVFADCSPNACVDVHIEKLYITLSGTVFIGTDGNESLLDCTASSGVYATLPLNQPGSDAIYSTLLAAQMAKKKVQVRISNGSDGCTVNYVTIEKQ